MIGVYGSSHPHGKIADANVLRKLASPSSGPAKGVESGVKPEIEISLLGRQLADAALRATERENSLSREQLGKKGFDTKQYLYNQFEAFMKDGKALFDADIPLSGDPEAMARASQAAGYLKGQAGNPFKGMSREQLGLIVYDESGEFTATERYAALKEAAMQDYEWRKKICEKMMDDYNRMAKFSKESYAELIAHEQSLPAIERAMSDKGYVAELRAKMLMAPSAEESEDWQFLDFWARLEKLGVELEETAFTSPEFARRVVGS
jgi:hypothetical protein